jgi:uncharacterized protein
MTKKLISEKIISRYSSFLTKNPILMFGICLFFIAAAVIFAGNVQNTAFDASDSIPGHIPVIAASNRFSDDFGGTESVMIVVQLNPKTANSNEKRDVRDPEVVSYMDLLHQTLSRSKQIENINSPSRILKLSNNGVLPKSKSKTRELIIENAILADYFAKDGSMARMTLSLQSDYDGEELIFDMEDAISSITRPAGISTNIAGAIVADTFMQRELGGDMSRTGLMAIVGIVLVLIIIFGSIKFGILPLTTIGVGVLWTFGYLGLLQIGINSATSGVLSMIIGIGIDFGIQVITRYRQELRKNGIQESMKNSLDNTLFPMFITTVAAIIGFSSMGMGQLSILKEIGTIMTYGVLFSFIAAVTFVPCLVIIIEKITLRIKNINFTWR